MSELAPLMRTLSVGEVRLEHVYDY
jgi:hypothetical protein